MFRVHRAAVLTAGFLILVACGDRPLLVGPRSDLGIAQEKKKTPPPERRDAPVELELVPQNTDLCSAVTYEATAQGRTPRRSELRLAGRAGPGEQPGLLNSIRYLRWDRATKVKLAEILCIVPAGRAAAQWTREYLERLDHTRLSPPSGSEAGALRIAEPAASSAWDTPYIHCSYDLQYDELLCSGEYCTGYATLRAEDFTRMANSTTFYCPNGCVIVDFAWYVCPDDGSGATSGTADTLASSGGGTAGNTTPTWEGALPTNDEDTPEESEPDCKRLQLHPAFRAYCEGHVPQGAELETIKMALNVLRSRGQACTELADAAAALLANNKFRVWTRTTENFLGYAQRGGDHALIADVFVKTYAQQATGHRIVDNTLESIIAHEMDHHLAHIDPTVTDERGHLKVNGVVNPWHTKNSKPCRGDPL